MSATGALAAAEHTRKGLLAEYAGDVALDEAEMAVKRATRVVEREIAAGAALDEKRAQRGKPRSRMLGRVFPRPISRCKPNSPATCAPRSTSLKKSAG
ncbi:MAG: hypothetical protein ACREC0_03150 [Methylocella sp.]